ncbi:MAG: hypothetical protein ACI84C_002294 [Flavobacteriales bacterium]|jgi:hypothetical protein
MKKLKRILLYLFGALVILLGTATVLVNMYEDEVTEYALVKIKASLVTNVNVDEVELTLWESFPKASIKLSEVLIDETFDAKDTLLYADRVFLEFNVWSFATGNYVVDEITISDALVNIKRLEDGSDNFHFWTSDVSETGEFLFELDQVNLENSRARIADDKSEFYLRLDEGDFEIAALVDELKIRLEGDASFAMHEISIGGQRFVTNKDIVTNLNIEINNGDNAYYIDESMITIAGVPIGLQGSVMDMPDGILYDLNVKGNNVSIAQLIQDLPEAYLLAIQGYQASGSISIDGSISGLAGSESQPDINTTFAISEGEFLHEASGVSFANIASSGTFEKLDRKEEKLQIDWLKAQFAGGTFALQGVIAEFQKPWIDINIDGNFNLNDLREFAEIDQLEELTGSFGIHADFEGKLGDNWAISRYILKTSKTSGQVNFENASFRLKNGDHEFDNLTGKFKLQNLDAEIEEFSGNMEESDFSLTGYFRNFLPYLLIPEEMLHIDASVTSSKMDFNSILASADEDDGGGSSYHVEFPQNVDFKVDLALYELKFREFEASNIRGKAVLKNQVLTLNPLSLHTAGGHFQAIAAMDGRVPGQFDFTCNSDLEEIQLEQLFLSFENFGQHYLTAQHLKGTADAHVDFSAKFDGALAFDSKSIVSVVDIKISNGELINFSSLEDISDYVASNVLLAPLANEDALNDKLTHVKFAELTNRIEIRNETVYIPKMTISSNAMDITAEGTHKFSNSIDYTVGFKIRDVLSKSNESEFGIVEDDGLSNSFFLSMRGPADEPTFSYDRLAHKEKRKEDRKSEIQNVKGILKDEFGFGKKDKKDEPSANAVTSKVDDAVITVSFDDDNPEAKPEKEGARKSFKDRFKQKEAKQEDKIIIEDDDDEDY